MKKRTKLIISAVIVVVVILVAVGVTLGIILSKKKKDDSPATSTTTVWTTTTASLGDDITSNSTFPNGSYPIDINQLKPGSPSSAPIEITIADLNQLGITVDNSSFIAETGRQSFFYIRLPLATTTTSAETTLSTKVEEQTDIGIRFGDSPLITVIPLSLINTENSGVSMIGTLPDSSTVYQIKITMAENMCSSSAEGACTVVNWQPYSIYDANIGSPANFTTNLPVACGSQCDAASDSLCASSSCTTCDGQQVAGENTPVTRRYTMGRTSGNLTFVYQTYTVPDRIRVFYENSPIFDSGCIGTEDEMSKEIYFSGNSQELRVDVEPNCDGTTSTAWYFTLPCLPPCSRATDKVVLQADKKDIVNGGKAYITEIPQMPSLIAYYCGNQSSTVNYTFTLGYQYQVNYSNPMTKKCDYNFQESEKEWHITNIFNDKISGGTAVFTWKDSEQNTGTINFEILGKNPTASSAMDYIQSESSLWYAQYIAYHESVGYQQFGYKVKTGYPTKSYDDGYGIFQITNPLPTCDNLWNWQSNCDAGITILSQKNAEATIWITRQRNQAREDTGNDVPVPCKIVEKCVFKDTGSTPIDDAETIKRFNGGYYCGWNRTKKCWYFNEVSSTTNVNYVKEICKLAPPSSDTCTNDEQTKNLCKN
uniref:Transglycosylase SLT domain-containing protein n=1 Tax=Panagrolaimus sp. PS1159 TaxID=55785 RepID=A0AC35FTB4_9BILA